VEPQVHAIRGGVDVALHTQRVLSLCTGYGGLELALEMAGLANRVERCRMLGNGVVPQQAAHAFKLLWERLGQ
jgi:hypothetical protein